MAVVQKSWTVATSGDTWTDLVNVASTVTSLTAAYNSAGTGEVAVRFRKGASTYRNIVPGQEISEDNNSQRFAIPSYVLESGDAIQVKSKGAVDWIANGGIVS